MASPDQLLEYWYVLGCGGGRLPVPHAQRTKMGGAESGLPKTHTTTVSTFVPAVSCVTLNDAKMEVADRSCRLCKVRGVRWPLLNTWAKFSFGNVLYKEGTIPN